jgi:hypothetical protein
VVKYNVWSVGLVPQIDWSKRVEVRESKWIPQNFRIINPQDSDERGVTYIESKRTWVTLIRHEDIREIMDTCVHESLHQAIHRMSDDFNTEEEHEAIKRVVWALKGWTFA